MGHSSRVHRAHAHGDAAQPATLHGCIFTFACSGGTVRQRSASVRMTQLGNSSRSRRASAEGEGVDVLDMLNADRSRPLPHATRTARHVRAHTHQCTPARNAKRSCVSLCSFSSIVLRRTLSNENDCFLDLLMEAMLCSHRVCACINRAMDRH
jgi:hypothetical protein